MLRLKSSISSCRTGMAYIVQAAVSSDATKNSTWSLALASQLDSTDKNQV